MKLFIKDPNGQKLYLPEEYVAPTRRDLARKIGSTSFILHDVEYAVNEVYAENEKPGNAGVAGAGGAAGGAALLGYAGKKLFGNEAGLIGAAIGAALGGIGGAQLGKGDAEEKARVKRFNESEC